MRFLNSLLLASTSHTADAFKDISVITRDVLKLRIMAGNGGNGIPRYNGIGGNGGSVFLRVDDKLTFKEFLSSFEMNVREVRAESGERSEQTKLIARNGSDKFLAVPHGVECVDESSMLLARCLNIRKTYLIARGGRGGCAENNYKRTLGETLSVYIHLKLRPNVGMLGFPNAGKSTLLKALIPEKPVKIANYPFTTLKPQMCYLKFQEEQRNLIAEPDQFAKYTYKEPPFTLSVADLPGIIEGASRNRGVGHAFLKHLEYSDIIAMVVDVHGFQLAATLDEPFRTALETIALLNREAETYSKKLLQKRFVLVLNKIDINDGEKKAKELMEIFRDEDQGKQPKWVLKVAESLRPRRPIVFEDVVAISARNSELGNLKSVLKSIHDRLHPRRNKMFVEEVQEKNRLILM